MRIRTIAMVYKDTVRKPVTTRVQTLPNRLAGRRLQWIRPLSTTSAASLFRHSGLSPATATNIVFPNSEDGRNPQRILLSTHEISETYPSVTIIRRDRSAPSTVSCSLVVSPPLERPGPYGPHFSDSR
jgi:hypothetical protein